MCRVALLTFVALIGAVAASSAAAAANERTTFTVTSAAPVVGLCSFTVQWQATTSFADVMHFNADGVVVAEDVKYTEQDTLSANGKTLVGEPYSGSMRFTYNPDGSFDSVHAAGGAVKFALPDGGLWIGAGRTDLIPAITAGTPWGWSVDVGKSPDPAPLCAALAP